jgi:hypothetical protein
MQIEHLYESALQAQSIINKSTSYTLSPYLSSTHNNNNLQHLRSTKIKVKKYGKYFVTLIW